MKLVDFLANLQDDPFALMRFRRNPVATLEAAAVSSENRDILLSGDESRLRVALNQAPCPIIVAILMPIVRLQPAET